MMTCLPILTNSEDPADELRDATPIRLPGHDADHAEEWYAEGGPAVEEHLKDMMQELGNAINESLSESDRIAAAISEIKRAGYEVFLVLEATIGFNKREAGDDAAFEEPGTPNLEVRAARMKWTSQDQKFLKALKIAVDDESRS
jgi:hypothetical protein